MEEEKMFFLRGNGRLWCLTCAMAQFVGIAGKDLTPENILSFITNVRHQWEGDGRGGILEEVVNTQHLAQERCMRCGTPMLHLFTWKMAWQGEKRFLPSYDVAELAEYSAAKAAGVALPSPVAEWVPVSGREALATDLDPARWDRHSYIPFEGLPALARDMRVLVALDGQKQVYGTLVYVTEGIALLQLDEKRPREREAPVVMYPVEYAGLYLDGEGSAHYQSLCGLRDLYQFHLTFALLSEEERREQAPAPYTWGYTIVDPEGRCLRGVADTLRAAHEEAYLALCLHHYIDDPSIEQEE
jgi:hypothetical protein